MFKNVAAKFVVFAFDATTNVPKTGDAANITAYVSKDYGTVTVLGDTSATEFDATNAPGYYWFDAAQAETNADCLMVTAKSATANIKVIGAPAIIFTRPTTGWLAPTVAGRTLDVSAGGEAGVDWANVGSPTTSNALTGTTIATTQKVDVETIKTNPVVNAGTITFPTTATLASTTNITGGTITTVTNLTNAPTAGDLTATMKTSIENAVWDATAASHNTAGTTGNKLNSAASAGDPWTTALPGAYGAGSAGYIVGTYLDVASSTLATAATLATVAGYIDTEVAAIKAKTDNLPAAPAAVSDIPTAIQNADALLKRDMSAVTGESARSPLNALRFLRNKWSVSGGTLTVTKEDDTTSAWTATVSTDAAAIPIIGSDPA